MTAAPSDDLAWAQALLARAGARREGPARVRELAAALDGEGEARWCATATQLLRQAAPVAVGLMRMASTRWPSSAEVRYALGNALRVSGDAAGAEHELREVLAAQPDHQGATLSLAFMLRDQGRLAAAARVVLDRARRAPAAGAEAALQCGGFLEECAQYALALDYYEECLQRDGNSPSLLFASGDAALTLGKFSLARERITAALAQGLDTDDWSGAWLRLANAQRYERADHPDFSLFERQAADPARGTASRAAAGFALGKALDDVGDYGRAAAAWRVANGLQASLRPWAPASFRALVEHQLRLPAQPAAAPVSPARPIFVVGLPRSGTSLIAERLARHPDVRNRGEMNWLQFLAQRLHADRVELDPGALQWAAAAYHAHLRQDDAPAAVYVDKNPLNFRFLGLAAAMFPRGRIVHCVRDRRDVALSLWSQQFTPGEMDFAYDFAGIRTFFEGHDALMRHWAARSIAVLPVEYEAMVARPAEALRALGEFAGLQGLEHAAEPSTTPMPTASVWQARQPIYSRAVARWERYAPFVPELPEFGK